MSSIFKSVIKLLRNVTGSKVNQETPMHPNVFVFPRSLARRAGFDQLHTPDDLLYAILRNPHAVDSVGTVMVPKVFYYKARTGAQHEFLILKVTNSSGTLVNYIKVDRCPVKELRSPPNSLENWMDEESNTAQQGTSTPLRSISSGPSSPSFSSDSNHLLGEAAQDRFCVSATGLKTQLVENAGRSAELASLTLPNVTLEQLLVLARVVSASQPKYHLFRAQCYWYVFTIWEVLKIAHPGFKQKPQNMEAARSHSLLPWISWHEHHGPETENPIAVRSGINRSHMRLSEEYLVAWGDFSISHVTLREANGARANEARVQAAQLDRDQARREAAKIAEETALLKRELEELRASWR
ncbi:hypothetical protein FRC10_011465 [Ceratobasidium sp. 414]|nr:hypothetical protein FRC10_011465 [Ceratobasidium sp. 414]